MSKPNQNGQIIQRKFSLIAQPNSVPYTDENGEFSESWKEQFGGGSSKSALQVTCSYNDDVLKGVAVVVDETTITTKSNGLATFTGLDSGTKSIVASKDGYATTTSSKVVENPLETADVEMNPITLTFSVKNAADEPINGATVNLDKKVVTNDTTHSGTIYNAYTPESGSSVYTTDDPIQGLGFKQLENCTNNNCSHLGNGIFQGGNDAYILMNSVLDTQNANKWEIHLCYTHNTNPNDFNALIGQTTRDYSGMTLMIRFNGALQCNILSSASSWLFADVNLNLTMQQGTTYYMILGFDSSLSSGQYYFKYNTDGSDNYTTSWTYTSATKNYQIDALSLLGSKYYTNSRYNTGKLDITKCKVIIDDTEILLNSLYTPSTLYSYDNITLTPLNPQPEFTVKKESELEFSVVGTLTKNNNEYSGFSLSNYINLTTSFTSNTINEMQIKFTTGNSVSGNQFLIFGSSGDDNSSFAILDGTIYLCNKQNGYSWGDNNVSTDLTVSTETTYWFKIKQNDYYLETYLSIDGINWTQGNTVNRTRNFGTYIGVYTFESRGYFQGIIDLNETYIIINNIKYCYTPQNSITINNVFYNQTPSDNLVEYKSETLSAITNSQGIAVISAITDGKYDYSVLKELYETMYGQIIINRANQTEPIMMYTAPINCYAAEAVTVDNAVKLNAGVGDSNTDYDVYASNTTQTNDLTLDGFARSSASAGEIAEVRITDYKEQTITIEVDQDNADIQFNNSNDICTVNIVADMKETHSYLAFKRQSDNSIIYFKDRTYPFVPSDNNVNETSFTYYTYADSVMTEHTATTQSSSSGNSTYDGTTLTIHSATLAVDGVWTRDTADDEVIATEYDGATITTSGYLTTPQPIIPTNGYYRFAIEKSNDWDLMTVVGGAFTNLANLQEIVVPNNTVVDIYATKKNETPALLKSTYTNRLTITNDRIYRKVNFVLQVTNEGGANTTLTVNGISFTNTGSQQKLDVYAGQTVTYKVEKEGFATQTGTYTVADYPTIKEYTQSITLVAE